MQIAIIADGSVAQIGDHHQLFPNTSFTDEGPDSEFLAQNSALLVRTEITFDPNTEKLVPCEPFIEGDRVVNLQVSPLSEAELQAREPLVADRQRLRRNELLSQCDWTQLPDSPVDKQAWADYRQLLRDISQQEQFPWEVSWPTPPS